jgi:two-component system sensor histidine kinase CpxA
MINTFYWKTFLRFCAISLVLLLTISAVYFAFIYEKPSYMPNRPLFASYASAAVSVYEYGGTKALDDWLTRLEDERNIHMYLLDNSGHDVLKRDLPPDVTEAINQRQSWRDSLPMQMGKNPKSRNKEKIIFTQVVSKNGNPYILITALPPPDNNRKVSVDTAQSWGLRLIIIIGVCGIVCVWITWYLTQPVSKLRQATQEWSSGNLTARVSENLGNRQDEISALGRDLDKMAERLQNLMESQKRLLSDISHELRTPLARLQIALGLARKRSGDVAQTELDRIELEAERLNEMIGQILSLVRLDSLAQIENKEEIDIQRLLERVINNAEFEHTHSNKHVQLNLANFSGKLYANTNLLYSALENIIRNALRYTPENTTVTVDVSETLEHKLKISVRDFGTGVPEPMLTKLFEPFFRVADARDRNTGGYGLGLAIVKRAIDLHEGKVFASNATDGGLIVTVILPLTPSLEA